MAKTKKVQKTTYMCIRRLSVKLKFGTQNNSNMQKFNGDVYFFRLQPAIPFFLANIVKKSKLSV